MTPKQLSDLSTLCEMRFRAEQAKLRDIITQEALIRQKLHDLDNQQLEARKRQAEELTGLNSFGGDVLWHGWISRSRKELQIELARLLVRKDQEVRNLAVAYGKKIAAEKTVSDAKKEQESEIRKRLSEGNDIYFS